jgi:hypothetical protein
VRKKQGNKERERERERGGKEGWKLVFNRTRQKRREKEDGGRKNEKEDGGRSKKRDFFHGTGRERRNIEAK